MLFPLEMEAETLLYLLVATLGRVGLGMVDCGRPMVCLPLFASASPCLAGELRAVVQKDGPWVSLAGKYLIVEDFDDVARVRGAECESFRPVREEVRRHEDESPLPAGEWVGAHEVDSDCVPQLRGLMRSHGARGHGTALATRTESTL